MCEINPKRKEYYQLEFFTSHDITDDEWNKIVIEKLLELEQAFNSDGRVRVHVHSIVMEWDK